MIAQGSPSSKLVWTPEAEEAFCGLKRFLQQVLLVYQTKLQWQEAGLRSFAQWQLQRRQCTAPGTL